MAARSLREKNKGRVSEGGFFRLVHFVLRSDEFRALSPAAVKAFLALGAEYNGENNGSLALPRAQHGNKGFGKSGAQVRKAIRELIAAGFVVCTRPGKLRVGVSYYAITTEPMDASDKHNHPRQTVASHAWRRKNVGTKTVQMPERKPFTCAANDDVLRTETVLVDPHSGQVSRTETVHLYKLPSEAGSAAASAAADLDSDLSFKGSESRSAPTKSDEQTQPARARRQSAKPKAA